MGSVISNKDIPAITTRGAKATGNWNTALRGMCKEGSVRGAQAVLKTVPSARVGEGSIPLPSA